MAANRAVNDLSCIQLFGMLLIKRAAFVLFYSFSLKKLKSKEGHRLKRKQHKQSFQEKQAINDEILQQKEDSASQTQQKGSSCNRTKARLKCFSEDVIFV